MDIFSALLTDAQQVPLATWSWEEAIFFDLFLFEHIAIAISAGALIALLRMPIKRGLLLVVLLAIAWEVFECATNVFEVVVNRISDVVVAVVFSALTFWILSKNLSLNKIRVFFWVSVAISAVLLGFRFMALM